MMPNVKLVIKVDGKVAFEANLTALNDEAVEMLCKKIDETIDAEMEHEIADDKNQNYGKALEYVEPSFSAYE
jgi:hypothetical protein